MNAALPKLPSVALKPRGAEEDHVLNLVEKQLYMEAGGYVPLGIQIFPYDGGWTTNIRAPSMLYPFVGYDGSSDWVDIFVDGDGGANGNTGQSTAQAFRTLTFAITYNSGFAAGKKRRIRFKPGANFDRSEGIASTTMIADTIIEPWDGIDSGSTVIVENRRCTLPAAGSWTNVSGNIWTCTSTAGNPAVLVDDGVTTTDPDGVALGSRMPRLFDAAQCDAEPGSFYSLTTSLRYHSPVATTAAALAANIRGYDASSTTALAGSFKCLMIGLRFFGGSIPFLTTATDQDLFFWNCEFRWGNPGIYNTSTGLVSTSGSDGAVVAEGTGVVWHFNSIVRHGPSDNIDYKGARNCLEVNVQSYNPGFLYGGIARKGWIFGAGINNSSTGHFASGAASKIVSVGGFYGSTASVAASNGRVVHDVDGCVRFMVGATTWGSTGDTTNSGDVGCGSGAGDATQTFLYDHRFVDRSNVASASTYQITAQGGLCRTTNVPASVLTSDGGSVVQI